jgi:AraC-like DNA-binding protein
VETGLPAGEHVAPSDPVRLRTPRRELGEVLSAVWQTRVRPEAALTRVLPDAAVDLVFAGRRLVVAGPDTEPVRERLAPGLVLGFQLRPGAVRAVLGMPAAELLNARVELAQLWGRPGQELADRMAAVDSTEEAVRVLEWAILGRLHEAEARAAPLDRLATRVRELAPHQPDVRLLARDIGLGERQLLRRSTAAFGYGPRTLGRILRFQGVLDGLRSPAAPPLAELAARHGYTDQSHLTREVATFAGLTPGALRDALARPVGV